MATTASSAAPRVTPFPSRLSETKQERDNNYNNNNYTRTRAREILQIDEVYEDVLGRKMPRFVEREILGMLADGAEPLLIRDVLEYTACAPRPSWAYARTVLYRTMERGIYTSLGFAQSLQNHGRAGDDLPY